MKQGICSAIRDEGQGGIGSNHIIEFVVVDMKWLLLESSEVIARRDKNLSYGQSSPLLIPSWKRPAHIC